MRFSVIIPAYNSSDTLVRCLNSIQSQTFPDFQVLVVNDGSRDATEALARAYEKKDPRFCLISTLHQGAGAARNKGAEQAEGEYLVYLDADDYWIEPDLLRKLNEQIESKPADVYMYQMVKVTEAGNILQRYRKPSFEREGQILSVGDVYSDLVRDGQTLASACNKCVRRELLVKQHIRFREDVIGEDIDWVLQLFSHAGTICLLNVNAYAYTQHKGESRSSHPDAPDHLARIVTDWAGQLDQEAVSHRSAVAGLVAFEYGICMGILHRMSCQGKQAILNQTRLLSYGLDKKTALIYRFHRIFGFSLTCFAIRVYLRLRRIW